MPGYQKGEDTYPNVRKGRSTGARSGARVAPKRLERNESPSMSWYEEESSMLVSDVR